MSNKPKADSSSAHPDRKRGRGSSRGGLGKYLRARGRRGVGRPAQFHERLLLEGEKPEDEDEEAAAALRAKYGPRQLSSNAHRYAESEPELDSDGAFQDIRLTLGIHATDLQGEPVQEPEVDLSKFLERQRLSDEQGHSYRYERAAQAGDEDDIDHSLAHITSSSTRKRLQTSQTKGKMEELVWDEEFELLAREKAAAEAKWDLKERFKSKSEILNTKHIPSAKERKGKLTLLHSTQIRFRESTTAKSVVLEAPALPSSVPPKDTKAQMQDFLDRLLD